MDWLSEVDEWELVKHASCLSVIQLNDNITVEQLLPFMLKGGPMPPMASAGKNTKENAKSFLENDPRPPKKYWDAVMEEINELICGDSEKYNELRNKITASVEVGEKSVVALIASSVATVLGVEAAMITSLCAMCLFSVRKIGVNAYCRKINKAAT